MTLTVQPITQKNAFRVTSTHYNHKVIKLSRHAFQKHLVTIHVLPTVLIIAIVNYDLQANCTRRLDGTVGIVTRLQTGESGFRIPAGLRDFPPNCLDQL